MTTGWLSISLLGPMAVAVDGAAVAGFKYNKARALLAYLAVETKTPHPRAELCALLWPELPERAARRNLTQVLVALRETLGETEAAQARLLATPDVVQLNPETPFEVDAARFDALLDAAERHAHRGWTTCHACAERLAEALRLYRGDFLSQVFVADSAAFEEWALLWRERLRQRAFSALERLARRAEWCGAFSLAAAYARRLVELDPLREGSQRDLMRLLALDGQSSAAEAQYEQVRRLLASELALEPEPETQRLHAHLRTARPEALRRYAAPPVNGPQPPNALIGREADLAAVCEQLRTAAGRALTVTGAPGIGKTRLALAAAHALRFDFEDGVHLVELAPLAAASLVIPAIAQALGVKEKPGQTPADTLTARLKTQHTLLVLDNFEHVVEAAAPVAELLAACPAVTVLITSRLPLRFRAEQQYPLNPLTPPAAVELFSQRARAARPAFAPEGEAAGIIAALCAQVDYLPLAIELIAVRARNLTLTEVRQQLEQPLDALSQGARDLPARHRTLREAIGWSYERLNAGEQRVFAHLGVLAGGGTVSAVQALVGPEPPALAALEGLSEASLAQARAVDGETRFMLLETLRAYALERLTEQRELAAAQARQAEYYVGLAEQARPELEGPEQRVWLDRLGHEVANLRAALTWSVDHNAELGLRLALALWPFWMIRGYASEAQSWLRRLMAQREGQAAPGLLEAEALVAESRFAISRGDYRGAVALALRGRDLFLRLEHVTGIARALQALGHAQIDLGDYGPARGHLQESLELFQSEADRHGMATALNSMGYLVTRQGDYQAAQALTSQALALFQELNRPRLVAGLSINLGMTALAQGDYATAERLTAAGLTILRELDDSDAVPIALLNLGNIYQDTGDLERARSYFEEAVALGRALGNINVAAPLMGLGRVHLSLGDLAQAQACYAEALTARLRSGERRGIALALAGFAQLAWAKRQPDRAARLLGAAEALRTAIGAPIQPRAQKEYDELVSALRAALGEAGLAAAWREGGALTVEQAAALALE